MGQFSMEKSPPNGSLLGGNQHVAEIETRLQCTEGDFAVAVGSDHDRGGLDQVEMAAIPKIGLDDPPAADQAAA